MLARKKFLVYTLACNRVANFLLVDPQANPMSACAAEND